MATRRKNPRETESKIVVMLDGRKVGEFGPYQTARGALADAKTLAISRRDNEAANDGIDAVVHTYRDESGNEIGYSVEARRGSDEVLPQQFEVLLASARTAAARSGRPYARAAQKAVSVAFNPRRRNGPKKAADPYVFVEGRAPDGSYFGSNYRKSQLPALYDALRAAGVYRVTLDEKTDVDLSAPTKNPQITFKAKGKRVSFFAKKGK
jgi:hypothetical protein